MRSLGRALTVLTELGRRGEPMTLGELSELVDLHKSTVHRMLAMFTEFGLVRRDAKGRYSVGLGAIELARAAGGTSFVGGPVHDAIAALHVATNARAIYALPQFGHMVCAVASDRGAVSFPIVPLYTLLPLHSTAAGKAYLAYRPESEIDRFVAGAPFAGGTSRALHSGVALLAALTRIRELGYAVEDREFSIRGRAIAVPVLDRDRLAVASVALGLPDDRLDGESIRELAGAAEHCARHIGAALGGEDRTTAGPR